MQLASEILNLTPGTIYFISIICVLALLALKDAVANLLVAVLIYPVMVAVALVVMVAFTELQVLPFKPFAAWVLSAILSSAAGMGVGLIILVLGNRAGSRLVAWRMRAHAPVSIRHVRIGGPAD
jgi:hypothetical protein